MNLIIKTLSFTFIVPLLAFNPLAVGEIIYVIHVAKNPIYQCFQ